MGISMYDYQYLAEQETPMISNEIKQIFLEGETKIHHKKQQWILSLFHK